MTDIILPYHLVLILIISIVLLIYYSRKKSDYLQRNQKILWISILIFFTVYSITLLFAIIGDMSYQAELNSFDLNGDGVFSESEVSGKQEAVMSKITHDTGRNLSFISGLIFAFGIAVVFYLIAILFSRRNRK